MKPVASPFSPFVALLPAPASAPTTASAGTHRPTVRARLWCRAEELGERDAAPRLWLHLTDGRVLAFRLPLAEYGEDRVVAPLLDAIADDLRGLRYDLDLPGFGFVQVLYAAPVLPVPQRQPGDNQALTRRDVLDFARDLDLDTLDFLGTLGALDAIGTMGENPHNDFYASTRNYNRIAALPAELRLRRLQALQRFPALLAPLLLTAHRHANLFDGKRHAWRQPDPAVEAAIDAGRDLAGALARHYGISRGLVRAPLNAGFWAAPYAHRRGILDFLDALPDNKRPASPRELRYWQSELLAYFYLASGNAHLPDAPTRSPVDAAVHAAAFRLGWLRTWETCQRRFGPLNPALADARDFLAAAGARAAVWLGRHRAPAPPRLVAAWLAAHGLTGLLAASARWHRLRPLIERAPAHSALPAVLGHWQSHDGQARELLTPQALVEEGAVMRHCVGDYWDKCVSGDRIFALRLADGERATAQYTPHRVDSDDVRYHFTQLRGPANAAASRSMQAFAVLLAAQLNVAERAAARRAVLDARQGLERFRPPVTPRPAAWLDETSERQLRQALGAVAVTPPGPEVLLVAAVAGYAYHAGPTLEAAFAAGQPLTPVRELDNPYDPRAVRLDWQGHKIGYVPRAHNATIAAALDDGLPLRAHIAAVTGRYGEPWQRLEFSIETQPMQCTKLAA